MGCAPQDGELHRVTLELKGPYPDDQFMMFKSELLAVIKKHGIRIRMITTDKDRGRRDPDEPSGKS
jgi:hypothetical protein